MSSLFLAAVVAAVSASSPDVRDIALTSLEDVAREVQESTLTALAPPPEKAVLVTQSFGTITLDHRAHLARRHACKACHGSGPVTKLGKLPPKVAHDRCVGCHRQLENGPTACRDCHVKPDPAAPNIVATAAVEGPAPPQDSTRVALASAAAAAAMNSLPAIPVALGTPPTGVSPSPPGNVESLRIPEMDFARVRQPFLRIVGVGFSVNGGPGQDVTAGPALYVSSREGHVLLLYALEHGTATGPSRTLGLIGAGITYPVAAAWNVQGLLLGGFDAMEKPTNFSPTLGARLGIEWLGRRTSLTLAASAATDLSTNTNQFGQDTGGLRFSFCASVGYITTRD